MKHITFIALIVTGASVLAAGAALAKPHGHHGPRASFEELDANGDGEVTQAEMEALRTRHFSAADTNGDGALSLEELTARAAERAQDRAERMLEKLDANNDGVLSTDEMPQPRNPGKQFARLDADNSGGISKEEFDTAREKHRNGQGGKWRKHWQGQNQDQN
ncbi:calcium-binding protein [Epibacterium sp. SM1979]|uniref:Calcium-binding protein n=1 Tax=Tritonibacter litoralis TaxID=2662264 RepID=A0A843YC39_9RHOB|nr:EF-hand domain-containing protein [Tritonibacter litoralis]MQQ08860.1 calcium-binding protein [Tritonibacter litoralis]